MISFELSEDQKLLQQTVAAFAIEQMRPVAHDADERCEIPESIVAKAWELGLVAFHEVGHVPVALKELGELVTADAGEDRGVGDLPAVEVQDRQHRSVVRRVEELVGVPARRERAGLRFPVSDDARDEQIGIVEGGAEGVRKRVAELPALVDRAWSLGRDVARDPARERELAEQLPQAVLAVTDRRVDLGIRSFEVRVRNEPRTTVTGPRHVDRIQVTFADGAVEVGVNEIEPRRGAEMSEQPRLDVLGPERLAQ